jgi:hypothetical protein
MDFTGKRTDIVDIGGDAMDYSGKTWFQDRPPMPPPVGSFRVYIAHMFFS